MQSTQFLEQIGPFFVNHWPGFVALFAILILIAINERMTLSKQAKQLSPQAAVDLINSDKAVVFDLRDRDAFRAGHIINAIQVTPDEFDKKGMDKYKTKPLIFVCARGVQSASLAAKLRKQHYDQSQVLAGGMTAWQTAGFPSVKGKE